MGTIELNMNQNILEKNFFFFYVSSAVLKVIAAN
jgi:hypothetical protein